MPDAVFDARVTFHTQLQRIEYFRIDTFVIHINALYDIFKFAFEQLPVGTFEGSILHLLFQLFTQFAVKLIDVLLLVDLIDIPPKSLEQLKGPHFKLAILLIVEDPLQVKRDRGLVLLDGQSGHLVDGISKRTDEKLALNETVHVACRTFVH